MTIFGRKNASFILSPVPLKLTAGQYDFKPKP